MEIIRTLAQANIQPTPQRIAVAEAVMTTKEHPSADEVFVAAQRTCPTISRATVYNTLKLLAEKGLVREQVLREGAVVYDAIMEDHHHFVDEESGQIHDVPWEAVKVTGTDELAEFEVRSHQVVMRGRWKK